MVNLKAFCELVRNRSQEHKEAIELLYSKRLIGQTIAILRQELDSMVRVLYLLQLRDSTRRDNLMGLTLNHERWRMTNNRIITDKAMVDAAQNMHGWIQSVYKLGCGFIHLSSFHDYQNRDPFQELEEEEKTHIIGHLQFYHGFSHSSLSVDNITPFILLIFEKVRLNLRIYILDLEKSNIIL